MPLELVALAARTPALREYRDEPLREGEVRVRTLYGAPKHGTELHLYRGDSSLAQSHWDPKERLYVSGAPAGGGYPRSLGNIAVGVVSEVGGVFQDVGIGDRVAGYGPLRETQRWTWGTPGTYPGVRRMPDRMSWQEAVCLDPATVALGGVRDGKVRVGDRVAVFGLGAIGLMAMQIAKIAGASFVIAVDPIAGRRAVATNTGADLALDPRAVDVGLEVRRATGGMGVDVSIETSGAPQALQHAVRGLAFAGTVAVVAWYSEIHGGLDLGREAHMNRPTFVFPRAESEPHYDHPRWNNRRLSDAAWDLLATGRLTCEPVVQPIVPFSEVVAAYREIDEHPERSVKLGVQFGPA
jgi:threonine dehydrogenase-like Zn-dependent dehydrogenase